MKCTVKLEFPGLSNKQFPKQENKYLQNQ